MLSLSCKVCLGNSDHVAAMWPGLMRTARLQERTLWVALGETDSHNENEQISLPAA